MFPLNVLAVPEAESRSDQRPGDKSLPSHHGSTRVQTASCRHLQPVRVSLHGSHHNGSSARGADVAGGDGAVLQETWRGVSLPAGPLRACVPGSGRGRMPLGDDDVGLDAPWWWWCGAGCSLVMMMWGLVSSHVRLTCERCFLEMQAWDLRSRKGREAEIIVDNGTLGHARGEKQKLLWIMLSVLCCLQLLFIRYLLKLSPP